MLPVLILPLLAVAPVAPAAAAPACPPGMTASGAGDGYLKCTGRVPSFDGVPLDTDVTLPTGAGAGPWPLLVFLHGWGNSKTDWESQTAATSNPDTNLYNNAAFAKRGYAVLNYTARGFHGSCGLSDPSSMDPRCATGWVHLADRRWEVADTHHLAGLLADQKIANPRLIGVTGGSYGGGQSWLLALEGDRTTATDGSLHPWTSPLGTPMHLAVAVPKYPWSDLAHSLVPNGRASDGLVFPDRSRTAPIGVDKASYVSGLFADGAASARYAIPGSDPTADLATWYLAITSGEPGSDDPANPVIAQALDQLKTWRSPYYQDALIQHDVATGDEVPVLDIQGFTDPLFPEAEGVSMYNKIRAADRRWPAAIYAADIGHSYADNYASQWVYLNQRATDFIDHYLNPESDAPAHSVAVALQTTCTPARGEVYTSSSWAGLADDRLTLRSDGAQTTTSSAVDPDGPQTDPIAQSGCRKLGAQQQAPGVARWEWPATSAVKLVGQPGLRLEGTVAGTDAVVAARLWDVAADGSRTLVTRGVYRFQDLPGGITVETPLWGNAWTFPAGHTIRLEVTQVDGPYTRPDNLPSAIAWSSATLILPVR